MSHPPRVCADSHTSPPLRRRQRGGQRCLSCGRLQGLNVAALRLQDAAHPNAVLDAVLDQIRRLGLQGILAIRSRERREFVVHDVVLSPTMRAAMERYLGDRVPGARLLVDRATPLRSAVHERRAVFVDAAMPVRDLFRNLALPAADELPVPDRRMSLAVVPLVVRGEISGIMALWGNGLHARDLPAISLFAQQAATVHENLRLVQEVRALAQLRDEFLTVAAHELRSPLTVLKGYADLLLRRLSLEDRRVERAHMAKHLARMDEQIDRLALMVEDLLDVSRLQTGRVRLTFQGVDVVASARAVLARFRAALRGTGSMRFILESSAPEIVVRADPLRLEQILANLVENAILYARPEVSQNGANAQVAVQIRTVTSDGAASEGWAEVRVRDDGVGIAPEHLPHVFERFYQPGSLGTRRSVGLGMGLSIVKGLVEAHGGAVRIESARNHGTTVTFTLPLARDKYSLPPAP